MKLSGISYASGCHIYSDHYHLHVFERGGKTKFTVVKKKHAYKVNPFIFLFPLMDLVLLAIPIIVLFFEYIASLVPEDITTGVNDAGVGVSGFFDDIYFTYISPYEPWAGYAIIVAFMSCYIFFIVSMVLRARKWHGCEHKLIAAAEAGDVYNAREFSPIHDKCGTTYLATMAVLMMLPLALIHYPIFTLVGVGMYLEGKYFHDRNIIGITIGRFIQKYNALEPEGAKIHVGMKGMNELVKKENGGQ